MTSIALVTGSGRGIGAATAKLAARRGVAVCDNELNREDRARQVADEIRAGGGRAIVVQADTGTGSPWLRRGRSLSRLLVVFGVSPEWAWMAPRGTSRQTLEP